jgi:hypothetical protein
MKLLRMKTQLKKLVTSIHYLFLPAYIALIFVTAQSQKETANLTIRSQWQIIKDIPHPWLVKLLSTLRLLT